MKYFVYPFVLLWLAACASSDDNKAPVSEDEEPQPTDHFYYGADLSYVNEMEDCGATYYNRDSQQADPYFIFKAEGANLVRLRLWHNPTWTSYSNFDDVKKSIKRAKEQEMDVLLDFHYSDTWADPNKQEIPAAWLDAIDDQPALEKLLYDYTYNTLKTLHSEDLLPDIVQVGNEINPMILQEGELQWPIDWPRNAGLINSGIKAVRDISTEFETEIDVMLHIAQPENAIWWFEDATAAGVNDFDWIGLSYYPLWSDYKLDDVDSAFKILLDKYNKRLMVVETAYPYTLEDADEAGNILGTNALIDGYPASEEGQFKYLQDLQAIIASSGGEGLIYWEPAWVSTGCSTLWGTGSHWDNATLFDHDYKPTQGMQFYNMNLEE